MENVSKAILMAGGVLLAMIVLGAFMLMMNNVSGYRGVKETATKSSQIAEFNNEFMPYDKSDLTILELKTVYNKILDNNINHPEWSISTNIERLNINFDNLSTEDKKTKRFKCTQILYRNQDGRISRMKFEQII